MSRVAPRTSRDGLYLGWAPALALWYVMDATLGCVLPFETRDGAASWLARYRRARP